MSFDFTQGDPRLVLDENGADLVIVNGQPVMDQGLENAAFISLWTSEFWGDSVMPDASQRVASTFEEISRQAITVSALQRIQAAGKRALKWLLDDEIAGDVEVKVSNPESSQLSVADRKSVV